MDKKFSEMKSELGRVRSYSAKLRDELRVACVSLESEKNKQDHVKKELEELKSLHKALLYQSKHEKEKLLFNMSQLKNINDRLTKDLESQKEEKTTMQNRSIKLENELKNKQKQIEFYKTDFQRNPTSSCNINVRKVSADEAINGDRIDLSNRRRTYSDRSEQTCRDQRCLETIEGEENSENMETNMSKAQTEIIEHDNTQLIDLERKLERLLTERDFALEYSKSLEEQVKNYQDGRSLYVDKGTSPIDNLG